MHSTLFSGRSFAAFPILIFAFSFIGAAAVLGYSTLDLSAISTVFQILGVFVGLSVGAMGFSSRDAMKNILGPTNFLVYSSRTLPVSQRKLLASFLIKDLIYYTFLFLAPVSLGLLAAAGLPALPVMVLMVFWFFAGIIAALTLSRTSIRFPAPGLNYGSWMNPLSQKSILDVWRSTGGIIKILFSFGVLTGFYWIVVLYFPLARSFLNNPLLSYSVLAGTISLTVYNWLNRFDSVEEYEYLPIDSELLLEAKQHAFLALSTVLILVSLGTSYYFYRGDLILSFGTAMATQLYTLGIASYLTGLEPNSRLFDSLTFLKYLLANSLLVMPLLVLSIIYNSSLTVHYVVVMLVTALAGFALVRYFD